MAHVLQHLRFVTPHVPISRLSILVACGLAAACAGTIVEPDGEGSGPGGSGSASGKTPGGTGMSAQALCTDPDTPAAGPSPLRRLTRLEYDNSIAVLLGDTTRPAQGFAPDEAVGGYYANSVAAVDQLQTEDYLDAAEDIAKRAVSQKLDSLVSCDIATDACGQSFIESFGRRAFRRPLSTEEQNDYFAVYKDAKSQWGADTAIELVLRGFLASPNFLYLVEKTEQAEGNVARIDAYTLASRLSFFIWASAPDKELLDAAAAGALGTVEGIEKEARRLLEHDRAKEAIASFHEQWLGIDGVTQLEKDPDLFPEWNSDLAASALEETRKFSTHVVLADDAKLSTLLTADYSFVDGPLAKVYGAAAPSSPFAQVSLDSKERAGVLTHASMLASHSGSSETSWVHRGKIIREQFLCDPVKAPPVGVETNEALDPGRLTNPECSGCHLKMDPIGTGFDAYSPSGSFRLVDEEGHDVDASGEILGDAEKLDAVGTFNGAVELSQQLAASEDVGLCVAVQWFRFASRRLETNQDACSVAAAQEEFTKSGQDIRELIVSITKSHAFRYRAVAQ